MNRRYAMVSLVVCIALLNSLLAQDEQIDMAKLRRIHEKAKSGQTLTTEEQAYYQRGKAARRQKDGKQKAAPKVAVAAAGEAGKAVTGLVPLCDMKADQKYKGEDGGLY